YCIIVDIHYLYGSNIRRIYILLDSYENNITYSKMCSCLYPIRNGSVKWDDYTNENDRFMFDNRKNALAFKSMLVSVIDDPIFDDYQFLKDININRLYVD